MTQGWFPPLRPDSSWVVGSSENDYMHKIYIQNKFTKTSFNPNQTRSFLFDIPLLEITILHNYVANFI